MRAGQAVDLDLATVELDGRSVRLVDLERPQRPRRGDRARGAGAPGRARVRAEHARCHRARPWPRFGGNHVSLLFQRQLLRCHGSAAPQGTGELHRLHQHVSREPRPARHPAPRARRCARPRTLWSRRGDARSPRDLLQGRRRLVAPSTWTATTRRIAGRSGATSAAGCGDRRAPGPRRHRGNRRRGRRSLSSALLGSSTPTVTTTSSSLGTPPAWLPALRQITTEDQLLDVIGRLPQDVASRPDQRRGGRDRHAAGSPSPPVGRSPPPWPRAPATTSSPIARRSLRRARRSLRSLDRLPSSQPA